MLFCPHIVIGPPPLTQGIFKVKYLLVALLTIPFLSAADQPITVSNSLLDQIANPAVADVPGAYRRCQQTRLEREEREAKIESEKLSNAIKKIEIVKYCKENPSKSCDELLILLNK